MAQLNVKRVYEETSKEDGVRVLVDRMWPRGFSKDDKRVDRWFKEAAPSDELRKWFHESSDFANFSKKYRAELEKRGESSAALDDLLDLAKSSKNLTLVYASKDEEHNNAVVLKKIIEKKLS